MGGKTDWQELGSFVGIFARIKKKGLSIPENPRMRTHFWF
jgi:hypothetical protein